MPGNLLARSGECALVDGFGFGHKAGSSDRAKEINWVHIKPLAFPLATIERMRKISFDGRSFLSLVKYLGDSFLEGLIIWGMTCVIFHLNSLDWHES